VTSSLSFLSLLLVERLAIDVLVSLVNQAIFAHPTAMMEFRISSCILVLWPTHTNAYGSTSGQFSFRLNEMKHNSSLAIIRYAICSVFFDVKLVSLCCPSDQKPSLPCKSSASREDQNPDGITSARATRQTSYAEAYYKIFCDIGYPLHIERLITSKRYVLSEGAEQKVWSVPRLPASIQCLSHFTSNMDVRRSCFGTRKQDTHHRYCTSFFSRLHLFKCSTLAPRVLTLWKENE
jgi:hypothetical protein